MEKPNLICFGSGDGWPQAYRNHSSFLYGLGDATVLADCGEPVSSSYKASGLGYDVVDRILISHLHFDHVGGFFMLIQGFWLEGRRRPLEVFMPAEGIPLVKALLRAGCIFDELLPFRLEFHPLVHGESRRIGDSGVSVTAFYNTHLATLKESFQRAYPQAFESFSFLIESERLRIAHSADLGAPEDLAPLLEGGVDLLVCELAHFAVEDLFRFLRGKRVGRVLFVHLNRENRRRMEALQAMASEMLEFPVSFAEDGLRQLL